VEEIFTFSFSIVCPCCGRHEEKSYHVAKGTKISIGCAVCKSFTVEFVSRDILTQLKFL
jgi:hypothetical protein